VSSKSFDRELLESVLETSVVAAEDAPWGFTNQTALVELAGGERVVFQRYRRRDDAEYRIRVMQALWEPASEAGIRIPRVRASDLAADPPWTVFEALPGIPVPAADEVGLGGPKFPAMAEAMGELLARLRTLSTDELELKDLWSDPSRLAREAAHWTDKTPGLGEREQASVNDIIEHLPELFAGRPAVFAHGDFAPVNVLIDGDTITGIIDFESARLADPLFDVAWWAWAVAFHPSALNAGLDAFLGGAGIDRADLLLPDRINALQVLRMLELLTRGPALGRDIMQIVFDRLRVQLAGQR
jgi:aminoglycoside phosphotransferase (APT) family kinase protein